MTVEFTVISIGALSHNRLWGEAAPVRTAHATTTLVSHEDRLILVDPSLPSPALEARFHERTGRPISDVTDVFCTTLRPIHRRGIPTVENADWWVSRTELEAWKSALAERLDSADRLQAEEADAIRRELKLLNRFRPAPEQFTPQVALYPLAGPSEGSAGLLLTPPTTTIVIAGDAALTREHVERGQVWEGCVDRENALESLRDLLELADVIVPGHDNVMLVQQRMM